MGGRDNWHRQIRARSPQKYFTREKSNSAKKAQCCFCDEILELKLLAKATSEVVPSNRQEQFKSLGKRHCFKDSLGKYITLICRDCRELD